jgi:hypothetical protein
LTLPYSPEERVGKYELFSDGITACPEQNIETEIAERVLSLLMAAQLGIATELRSGDTIMMIMRIYRKI